MERITISVDDDLLAQFDSFMERNGYGNRSEAFRDLLREKLESERLETDETGQCVGCLTYIYDHASRELASRITHTQHAHHDLGVSTLHVHLSHEDCLETVILRGEIKRVKSFANAVVSQPGVRHGNLHLVPTEVEVGRHRHGTNGPGSTAHVHSRPKT